MAEATTLRQFDLRLDPAHADLLSGVAGIPRLSLEPNTATSSGTGGDEIDALWLGPDEWLFVAVAPVGETHADELGAAVAAALGDIHHSFVDVSANRVAVELGGEGPQLLAAGCTLDLHPTRWSVGSCAQTLLAGVPVLLHERPAGTRLYVRPSYAAWLGRWLDAARATQSIFAP